MEYKVGDKVKFVGDIKKKDILFQNDYIDFNGIFEIIDKFICHGYPDKIYTQFLINSKHNTVRLDRFNNNKRYWIVSTNELKCKYIKYVNFDINIKEIEDLFDGI